MMEDRKPLSLPQRYLAIVLLPLLVYFFSEWLLWYLGRTELKGIPSLLFDAHREGAARFRVLGTFFLLICAASAAIGYFLFSVLRLNGSSRRVMGGAFAATIATSAIIVWYGTVVAPHGGMVTTQEMMGDALVVQALSQRRENNSSSAADPASVRSAAGTGPSPRARRANAGLAMAHIGRIDASSWPPQPPPSSDYPLLRNLINAESGVLLLAIPSLAFGAILCLAWPPPAEPLNAEEEKALRDEQIGRLNTFLYLSALMLVAGLLFLSAFLHWPLFALPSEMKPQYQEHIHAVVLFNGVVYTVLLASYYLPVAGLLARRWRHVKPSEGESGEMLDWRGFLKAALAVFAPLVIGLLGEVMKIPLAGG